MHHETLDEALPGDIVGFHVTNVPAKKPLRQGYVASDSKHDPAMKVTEFTSHVVVTNYPGQIGNGYTPVLHCHTSHVAVKFAKLVTKLDWRRGVTLEKEPEFLRQGEAGIIKMIPTKPMVVEALSEYPALGRFVVRDKHLTVAFGVIKSVIKDYSAGYNKISKTALKKLLKKKKKALDLEE